MASWQIALSERHRRMRALEAGQHLALSSMSWNARRVSGSPFDVASMGPLEGLSILHALRHTTSALLYSKPKALATDFKVTFHPLHSIRNISSVTFHPLNFILITHLLIIQLVYAIR
jgi:hypothetical protein